MSRNRFTEADAPETEGTNEAVAEPTSEFVDVYNTITGEKQPAPVPAFWLDDPILGANLARVPSDRDRGQEEQTVTPSTDPTDAPSGDDDTTKES